MLVPRSQIKKISDMIELIRSDEVLRREFAELILSTVEHDLSLSNKIADIVSKEMGSRMIGY
jgi:hypothetical protein